MICKCSICRIVIKLQICSHDTPDNKIDRQQMPESMSVSSRLKSLILNRKECKIVQNLLEILGTIFVKSAMKMFVVPNRNAQ